MLDEILVRLVLLVAREALRGVVKALQQIRRHGGEARS